MGLDSDAVKDMMPFTSKMIAQSGAVDGSYWGISDKNGNMKVDYLYTEVENQYHGNRIGVAVNNAWGL